VVDLEEKLWKVKADPNQVQQVMMNMAVNARDVILEGGRIAMRTRNLELDDRDATLVTDAVPGEYVHVAIEDTGSGMSPEVKSKIFEPFFTTKEQGKGTGLGLATSYGIVQQHGGWIACESEEGVGTTFHIYFPREVVPEDEEMGPEGKSAPVKGGTETVLLVDDELVVRMVGEGVLKHHGYRILTAGNGEEALEIVRERGDEIDIVMLDLTMPKMSGKDTLKHLRDGSYPYIPVLICSGYLLDLENFGEETGITPEGFVQKPYDSEDLCRTLREVLDVHQQNEKLLKSSSPD
ncbi:MAG: ATP-binding protein, partial [Verrucomicrobiota bacterium]